MTQNRISRFRIDGMLTTQSPLHIGSGEERVHNIKGEEVKVKEVIRDSDDLPHIPGSTIKGLLRQRAEEIFGLDNTLIRDLFGSESHEQNENDKMGGRLLFQDCPIDLDASTRPSLFSEQAESGNPYMFWDDQLYTYIQSGIALNRVNRTVEPNKLFYYKVVPTQTVFYLSICADSLTEKEVGFLLQLLDQFNVDFGITLGAFSARHFGRISWGNPQVSGLQNEDEISIWLNSAQAGFEGLPRIEKSNWDSWREEWSNFTFHPENLLQIQLDLQFSGPFLLNDPSQVWKAEGGGGLSHAYMKNEDGFIVLKASGFHGAIRTQAEKIVRTMIQSEEKREKKACRIESRHQACEPIFDSSMKDSLCMTCRLFGGNGWRTPIFNTDFLPVHDGQGVEFTQEMVAIDRFHGGSADGAKFNVLYRNQPLLSGTLTVDLSRISAAHLGLFALTMRDLLEGDITFGFGRSKGFGICRGRVRSMELTQTIPDWLEPYLLTDNKEQLTAADWPMADEQLMTLQMLSEEFNREVDQDVIL